MYHALAGDYSCSYEDVAKWVDEGQIGKLENCFPNDIHKLSEKWMKVVASDGEYFAFYSANNNV